jgi:D-hexose-6-phosphate mutarotase
LCCDNSHGLKKHLRWNLISKINEKQVILISTKLKPEAQLSVETMQKTEII